MDKLLGTAHALKVGDWVEVLYAYAPGLCSDGGVGEIRAINHDEDGRARCNVTYVLDHRIEVDIDPSRITVTIMPYKDTTSTKRLKRAVSTVEANEIESSTYAPPMKTPLEWLKYGLSSRTHEKRGWLRDKLLQHNFIEGNVESLWKRIISDYKGQLEAIEGMQFTMGSEFKDPRETRCARWRRQICFFEEGQPIKRPKEYVDNLIFVACIRRETVYLQRQSSDG